MELLVCVHYQGFHKSHEEEPRAKPVTNDFVTKSDQLRRRRDQETDVAGGGDRGHKEDSVKEIYLIFKRLREVLGKNC